MSALTGTWRLTRLALRRDRIKLPIILIALIAAMAPSIASVIHLYDTTAERQAYASLAAPNVITRVFDGPLDGTSMGAIVMNETFLYMAVAIAFVSTLTVIRHTRQNEETGREELIGSAVVGRHASLVAALLVAVGVNVLVALVMSLSFIGSNLDVAGSIGAGVTLGCVGLAFAGIAAITAQISSSARGANGLAAIGIGIAVLLRAIGDATGSVDMQRFAVTSWWPSWLSPVGWGEQVHPFTGQHWSIFGLFAAFFAATVGLAFYLTVRRDIGGGLLQPRKGPARAAASLLSPLGLAWRLQRGTFRGWAVTLIALGISYGYIGKSIESYFKENPQVSDMFKQLGGGTNVTDSYLAAIISFTGLAIAGYAIQTLLRLRAEEVSGTLEPLLATGTSRLRWATSHISCSLGGVATLSVLSGLSIGITYTLVTDAGWAKAWDVCVASLVQLPAISVIGSVVALAFSLLPRLTVVAGWGALSLCLLIGQFGTILKLSHWLVDVSPFTHMPRMPAETFKLVPILWLSVVALGLFVTALAIFRRRDIARA